MVLCLVIEKIWENKEGCSFLNVVLVELSLAQFGPALNFVPFPFSYSNSQNVKNWKLSFPLFSWKANESLEEWKLMYFESLRI